MTRRPVGRLLTAVAAVTLCATAVEAAAPAGGDAAVWRSFIREQCLDCHDAAAKEGNLSIEALPDPAVDYRPWVRLHDRIRAGEMPPADVTQPPAAARAAAVASLAADLAAASRALQEAEGRVVLRRLNRTEYETTLADLLCLNGPQVRQIGVSELLPPENMVDGFDNVADALQTSSDHLLRYQEAARRALRSVIPSPGASDASRSIVRLTGREARARCKTETPAGMLAPDGDALLVRCQTWTHIVMGSPAAPVAGRYVVRTAVNAVGTGSEPIAVRLSPGAIWGRDQKSVLGVFDAPADATTVIELACDLEPRGVVDVMAWSLPTARAFLDAAKARGGAPSADWPALAIEWIELEGPLDEFPGPGYRRLFGDLPLVRDAKSGNFMVQSSQPVADAQRLLGAFLPLAFRRPVPPALTQRFVKAAEDALARNASFLDAMLAAYEAALCSPHFLLIAEPGAADPAHPRAIDDHAVASRLSHFLWSSCPDDELLAVAGKGELRRPAVLRAQVERMLADPKGQRFVTNFTGQWLDLRKIDDTKPDPNVYREFDDFLFWSMKRETELFFAEILANDRSITEFVDSDWTFLNDRLAVHYGIAGKFGGALRMTPLPPGCHRGGVLTQASILKLTADGTKTSPVRRGIWVLDRIIGQPPPSPSAVPAFEPDIRGATTIRQQLAKHRNEPSCNVCHRHIDPPGFALESFDAVGNWREFYRGAGQRTTLPNYPDVVVGRGADVELGGETADGRTFATVDEYKRILLDDPDQLVRALAGKLVVYATGAEVQFADREAIEDLVRQARGQNRGLRSLIHAVVQSRLFLDK